jgi:hypothetical protein
VSICQIRPIRSPIVSLFSKAEIVVQKNKRIQTIENQ